MDTASGEGVLSDPLALPTPRVVIARLDRAIQYSETLVMLAVAAGYWMPRLKRGMTNSKFAPYSAACCATVGASPATVVRRMSRGWVSS